MSEQEREQRNSDDERAEVEGHRLNSSKTDDSNASDDDSSDDFEAHRRSES